MKGATVKNTLTGQNTGTKVVSESNETLPDGAGPNASGNEVAYCTFTLSTGADLQVTVTLFASGYIGFHGGQD
jgi:hypothetical protein